MLYNIVVSAHLDSKTEFELLSGKRVRSHKKEDIATFEEVEAQDPLAAFESIIEELPDYEEDVELSILVRPLPSDE